MASLSFPQQLLSHQKIDCLCSALGVNCFQFPCCFPNRSVVCPDADSDSDTSNWMKRLQELHPRVLLRDLVIVGTHDAGSYTISSSRPFSAVGRTQQLEVYEQLEQGARYLDLRVAGSGSSSKAKLVIQHGCLPGGSFHTVVQDIQSFLRQHQSEFVVVQVTPEYGQSFGAADRSACLAALHEAFQDMLLGVGDLRQAIESKTLQQVVEEDKRRVVVLLHPRFYNNDDGFDEASIRNEFGFAHAGRFLRNKWHDTRNIERLLECNLTEVQERGSDRKKWLGSQLILTPGVSNVTEVLQALVGLNPLRPVSWAVRLYQDRRFDEYIRQHAEEPWNLVMLDYVDLCPTAVDFLIALNFCSHLQIEAAVVVENEGNKVIVTQKLQEWVKRDRVLWLTNIPQDLDLSFREGTLTIAYRLAKDGKDGESISSYHLLYIDHWDSKTPLLLSQFASNTHHTTKSEVQSDLERGFVANGRVSPSREEATLMEFQWSGNVCSFNVE